MDRRHFISGALTGIVALIPGNLRAQSVLRVLSSSNMRPMLPEFARLYERTAGREIAFEVVEAVPVRDRILAGESFDVAVTQRPLLDQLESKGRIVGGSIADVARSTVSLVVRMGSPKPDIRSIESFVATLRAAESLAYPDPAAGGLAGIYLARAIARLGLSDSLSAKTRLAASGQEACRLVAAGTARLGVAQTSTALAATGVDIVGTLPRELGIDIVVAAGVVSGARDADGAKAFVSLLTSAAAAPVIRAGGMEP